MKNLFIFLLISLGFILVSCGDKCDDINCGANGTCVDGTCDCDEGYTGENCETNTCAIVDCGANGTCVNGTCDCDEGYSGANCEINVCDDVNCNNGNCDTATGECNCNRGYEGEFCETEEREKFIGRWFSDAWICDFDVNMGEIVLVEGPEVYEILVEDDSGFMSVLAIISGNELEIPYQEHEILGEMREFTGNGVLINNVLTLSLTDITDGDATVCEGPFMK